MKTRTLFRSFAAAALLALGACQTLPQVIATGADTFDVRYATPTTVVEVDARAAAICLNTPQMIGSGMRYDGFAYRSYRCHRKP